jgi:hypothetical protein
MFKNLFVINMMIIAQHWQIGRNNHQNLSTAVLGLAFHLQQLCVKRSRTEIE